MSNPTSSGILVLSLRDLSLGPIVVSDYITTEKPKWTIVLTQLENRNVFLLVCFSHKVS